MSRISKVPRYESFNQQANCYGRFQHHNNDLNDWLTGNKLMLEVGAGSANMSLAYAQDHHDWQVIALDRKSDRLLKAVKQEPPDNLIFLQTDFRQLEDWIDLNHKVNLIWITFPDPYPKLRSTKHRLTHPQFLEKYRNLLTDGGAIKLKTDSSQLFDYSQALVADSDWLELQATSRDLHADNQLTDEAKVLTTYEKRFISQGKPIFYLQATKTT